MPRLGLIGPWGHMMPHSGVPGPAIGFLQEALRWWDRWLKGIETGIMHEPMLRAWMQEPVAPAASTPSRPGRWVAVPTWPALASPGPARFGLGLDGGLDVSAEHRRRQRTSPPGTTLHRALRRRCDAHAASHQECGETAGVWCANGLADEIAVDQRPDDERSLTFTTVPLAEPLEVLGNPDALAAASAPTGRARSSRRGSRMSRRRGSHCS